MKNQTENPTPVPVEQAISPNDIDISQPLWGAFDNTETEVSAHYIIKLCQRRGSWAPFTYQEINDLYHQSRPNENFRFNALIEAITEVSLIGSRRTYGGGWIVQQGDFYVITPEFIERAFAASPRRK